MKIVKSIKGKLFLGIFFPITVFFIVFGSILIGKFRQVTYDSVDHVLHSKLQLVKGLMHGVKGGIEFEIDEVVMGEYMIPRSGHYYQIKVNGKIEVSSQSLADNNFDLEKGTLESYNNRTNEWVLVSTGPGKEPVRTMRHDFPFLGKIISVMVSESVAEHVLMMNRINRYFSLLLPVMIILVGAVSLGIVFFSLKPIKLFSETIEKITHESLEKRIETGNQARELAKLAESFNSLLGRLQAAFQSEKQLIVDAAHDLKTPLSFIMAQCGISLQKKRTEEEYIRVLQDIISVSENMQNKIRGMLTLARLDSGILSLSLFEKISLSRVLDDTLLLVRRMADEKKIRIIFDRGEEVFVPGNRDSLTEALLNIVENGIKFNLPGGSVQVKIEKINNRALLQVTDSGIGIKQDELERIFDRFYRSDQSRNTEGTGLGLSIARVIIEAHRGEIKAESPLAGGSTFVVSLPLFA